MKKLLVGSCLVALFGIVFATIQLLQNPSNTHALEAEDLEKFSQNNILYYDPTCNEGGTSTSTVAPTGDKITWIGDSYSCGALSIIQEQFSGISFGGSTCDPSSYIQSCKYVGEDTTCGGTQSSNPAALNILKKIIDAGDLKPYLVMAVGTNGGWSESDINRFKEIMSSQEDTKVVFVNSRTKSNNYSESNNRLKGLVDSNQNYHLADWSAAYNNSYFDSDDTHPTSNGGYKKWVETIKQALPSETVVTHNAGAGGVAGTGDFSKIMTAKNADKSFFNGSGDVPSASWSDRDTASMKQLLETYGDLAYQLGEAVGAPWIAILVQMRYEDSKSVCGRNNFWGNGCPPGTGVGGASRQGNNLGEGFTQYAETLTNGYHDQALGISDPKAYLEAIGPTWVQGDINGAGYGSINDMKKSVDALTAYVESPEGQEIVKTFGNYHGSVSGSGAECRCTDNNQVSSNAKWEDGWLAAGSISGMEKEDVNQKSDLKVAPDPIGSYTTDNGKPNKILLHSTEGTTNGYAAYPAGNKVPAHFTIDLKKKQGYQHFSLYQPSMAIREYDQAGPIQIEIVGFSDPSSAGYKPEYDLKNFGDEEWNYLVEVLKAISKETNIPLTSSVTWTDGNRMTSADEFKNYKGILGHMHATANTHNDPGNIWSALETAIGNNGGYDAACGGGGNGDINAAAIELAWIGGGHDPWNGAKPEYTKALASTGVNKLGDSCSMNGNSCDAFVATVMRYSGADPDFYCCGVSSGNVGNYIRSSGKYEEVPNNLDNLKPGDIRISSGHIELYVEVDGEPAIASASHCNRTGEILSYYDSSNFKAYRLKR